MEHRRSCRVCGRPGESRYQRAIFSASGKDYNIAGKLAMIISERVASDDGLSQVICRACKGRLDSFKLHFDQAEKIKMELGEALRKTSERHRVTLRWKRPRPASLSGTPKGSPTARQRLKRAKTTSPLTSTRKETGEVVARRVLSFQTSTSTDVDVLHCKGLVKLVRIQS